MSINNAAQTQLVPQSLVGLSGSNQSITINSTDGIIFNDATLNQTASLSWSGIITDKPTGFDILSKLNMNSQNIDNVDTLSSAVGSNLTLSSTEKGIVINGGDGNGGNNDITLTTIDGTSTGGVVGNIHINSAGTNNLTSTGILNLTAPDIYTICQGLQFNAGSYINLVCDTGTINLTSTYGDIDLISTFGNISIQPNNGNGTTTIQGLLINTNMNVNGFALDNCNTINSDSGFSLNETGGAIVISSVGDINITNDTGVNTSINLNTSNAITLNAQTSYIHLNASTDITLQSNAFGPININSPNTISYGIALPICLNQFEQGQWSYTLGGQVFENVFAVSPINIGLPIEFFALNTTYTSTRWQINFDMNCWNFVNAGDKGFAIYISFLDSNSNLYEPFLYNSSTPFCKWDNAPSFSGANSQFKSINWCDYVDFAGLVNSNDSNLQLQMYVAGDSPFLNVDFKFKLGFTRIQRI